MKKVLLIGQNGQVTTYLQRVLNDNSEYELQVLGRKQLDLTNTTQIQTVLESHKPSLIINPAAYTQVDLAEQETELAFAINRDAAAEIGQYCASTNTPLIHFSTDYVFTGDANTPYRETDAAIPTGVYGKSKLAGEQAIIVSGAPAIILRTSWVYSNHGKNFYKTMLTLAESRDELSVVNDQIGAPTYAGSIAAATKVLVEQIMQQGAIKSEQTGIYHFTCTGQTSWCEFAQAIFAANKVSSMTVKGIPSSEYPTPAKRPIFSVLDGNKLHSMFGLALPDWQTALENCAAETRALSA